MRRNPKPHTVEMNWGSLGGGNGVCWLVWNRYPTEARRDQALAALQKKGGRGGFFAREYRAGGLP